MASIDTTFIPDSNDVDNFISPIVQTGNYFIMDSEQLVSNPFQELQQEAVNEAQKKNSMTEKLTSVKNNVCENHFNMAKVRLERQKMSRLKQMHDNTNKLRHEVKLLDLDRQRHNIEVKKRMQPERDYSYDDTQVINMEKRLGANIASFYLERKVKYPPRLRSVSDISVTPTVRRARASLRQHDLQKSMDESIRSREDRVQTAKSVSTSYTAPSAVFRRRGSRSAPIRSRTMYNESTNFNSSTLPAIAPPKSQLDNQSQRGSRKGKSAHHPHPQVKFAFENPLKILASTEESAKLFAKSYTYYPGATRAVNNMCDSSDDDDDPYLPDHIDLKALFFNNGDDNEDTMSTAPSQHSMTNYLMALKKAQGPPPKLTTDMMQEEVEYINSKINKFLGNLSQPRSADQGGSSTQDTQAYTGLKLQTPRVVVSTGTTTQGVNTDDKPNLFTSNTKSTSTSDLFGQSATQIPKTDTTSDNSPAAEKEKSNEDQDPNKTPRKTKYSWKHIRGRQSDGQLRGTYKSEDLVLQSLTGVPISNALSTHIPLHSASRAMRHTATFKMHKIVEKLINERTKYERHQVEELKKQMVGNEDPNLAGSENQTRRSSSNNTLPGRRVSSVTMLTDRKIAAS